jgi:hypothetical protein
MMTSTQAPVENTVLNPLNLYHVVGNFTDTSLAFDSSESVCDIGDIVLEGGYGNPNADFGPNDVISNDGPIQPIGNTPNSGYLITVANL